MRTNRYTMVCGLCNKETGRLVRKIQEHIITDHHGILVSAFSFTRDFPTESWTLPNEEIAWYLKDTKKLLAYKDIVKQRLLP